MIDPSCIPIKQPAKVIEPLKIYPLADEPSSDLIYPTITHHFSVSGTNRYVYVIGMDPNVGRSHLYVWDLHRGVSRCYDVLGMDEGAQMKHLYETTTTCGFLVCKSDAQFLVHTIRVRHWRSAVIIERTVFRQPVSAGGFWSSARSHAGIVFVSQREQFGSLHVTEIEPDYSVRSVVLSTPVAGLRFCGQPWVCDEHIYLFESSALAPPHTEVKFLTGRLHRANLRTGQLDIVVTWARDDLCDDDDDRSQSSEQPQTHMMLERNMLVRRVKHVERDGWLWIITEVAMRPNISAPLAQNECTRCRIYMLDMDKLRWRLLNWQPNCNFDELTLDVSDQGTAVLLRKCIGEHHSRATIDAFMLVSRRPVSLLSHTFLALITYFPHIRHFEEYQMRHIGIPLYLLA